MTLEITRAQCVKSPAAGVKTHRHSSSMFDNHCKELPGISTFGKQVDLVETTCPPWLHLGISSLQSAYSEGLIDVRCIGIESDQLADCRDRRQCKNRQHLRRRLLQSSSCDTLDNLSLMATETRSSRFTSTLMTSRYPG